MASVIASRTPGGYRLPFPRAYQAPRTRSASATRRWVRL